MTEGFSGPWETLEERWQSGCGNSANLASESRAKNVFCDRFEKLSEKLFVSQRVFQEDLFSGIVQLDLKAKRREFFCSPDQRNGVGFRRTARVVNRGKNQVSERVERYDVPNLDRLNGTCFAAEPALLQKKVR